MRQERTEVLVVGAGPVGLWTALLLAEAGVEVTIIDREERTAARSYACALHARTLRLLEPFGLTGAVLEQGRRIPTVEFFDRGACHARLNLGELDHEYPFLLVLPQNTFEHILEQRLLQAGVKVRWRHRLDTLEEAEELVVTAVEELGGTSIGYIVPHWEGMVKSRWPIRAQFVVGADGHKSIVRQRAGLEYRTATGPAYFAAYEFESDQAGDDVVRVVLDEATTNVLWPLPGKKFRWTFQMLHTETVSEFPEKERRPERLAQPQFDEQIRRYVQKVTHHRAPWFSAVVKEVTWCSGVVFEQRLAQPFGRSRCWLVGDAAHQTGPVGVQSMNAGFSEGAALAGLLQEVLRHNTSREQLGRYDRSERAEWQCLLGLNGGLRATAGTEPWVRQHCQQILPCLPATGEELRRLAAQLKLEVLPALL